MPGVRPDRPAEKRVLVLAIVVFGGVCLSGPAALIRVAPLPAALLVLVAAAAGYPQSAKRPRAVAGRS